MTIGRASTRTRRASRSRGFDRGALTRLTAPVPTVLSAEESERLQRVYDGMSEDERAAAKLRDETSIDIATERRTFNAMLEWLGAKRRK